MSMRGRTHLTTGDPVMKEPEIKLQLVGEYLSPALKDAQSALAEGHREELSSFAQTTLTAKDIEFSDISTHGYDDEVITRFTIRVRGQTPPDGKSVRYYKLRFQKIGGWRVVHESSAWPYYSKLF